MVDQKVVDLVNVKVLPCLPQDKKEFGILVMLEIAAALISLIQNCPGIKEKLEKDSDKVMNWLKNPTFIHKARLYLTVRRQCRKANTLENLHTIVNAILDAGQTATKEDVLTIVNASPVVWLAGDDS